MKRQLMFLHRILNLEASDPVQMAFQNQMALHDAGETNWWSGVKTKLIEYNITLSLSEIKDLSREVFSNRVKKAVTTTALKELTLECSTLKKTSTLQYKDLATQDYLLHLFPDQARTVFKWRSRTLDLKSHLSYKYNDLLCRGCKEADEDVEHIINCGMDVQADLFDVTQIYELSDQLKVNLKLMATRIMSFIEQVSEVC